MRCTNQNNEQLSNHLGNVLAVITDREIVTTTSNTYTPEPTERSSRMPLNKKTKNEHITSFTDYYPFGSSIEERTWSYSGYRFGFNGKEQDKAEEGMGGGGSTYDYGFRIYNPAICKFLSVDPLSPDYPWYTPYQFAGNKPIWCIDLDGLEELFYVNGMKSLKYGGQLIL